MADGKIKWLSEKKGYGLIESETHGDLFVHYTNIEGEGFRTLRELETVTFEVEDSPKGPQAINVKRV